MQVKKGTVFKSEHAKHERYQKATPEETFNKFQISTNLNNTNNETLFD